jgi:hypothetical protein
VGGLAVAGLDEAAAADPPGIVERPQADAWADGLTSIHPNPFGARTTIRFTASRDGRVTVSIHDVAGRLVRALERPVPAGSHEIAWDGRTADGLRAPSGVYFARVTVGDFRETRRIVLLRRN